MIHIASEACQALAKEGLDVELIDLRSLRPIDYKTIITSVQKTNRLVIVAEEWPLAGVATELAFAVQRNAFDYLDAPILRVTSADTPLPYAPTLIKAYLPNVKRIVNAVKDVSYFKI